MPYMSDPLLIGRVQKYLERHTNQSYVDINDIVDELQVQFKEYSRRKRDIFVIAVKKAYSTVLARYGLESDNTPGNSDEDSDIDLVESVSKNDSLNNQLVNLYKNNSTEMKEMDENELIDISSDDESEQTESSHTTKEKIHNTVHEKNGIQQNDFEKYKKRKHDYATIHNVTSPNNNKKRKFTPLNRIRDGEANFSHIGGMEKTLEEVAKLLLHINHPEIYKTIGITPPRGFLLHGPPGCGKSLLAHAIAGELNIQLFKVTAPELVASISGESEQRIRNLFQRAFLNSPCVLFIDEIDSVTQNRSQAQKEMEKRIVAQLLSCLDELNKSEQGSRVLVIGATSRPETMDPALRRSGRFDREICLGIPNKQSRAAILKVVARKLKLEPKFDYDLLASLTPGYVGADLLALTREAAMVAVDRMIKDLREDKKGDEDEEAELTVTKPKEKNPEEKTPPAEPKPSTLEKCKDEEKENDADTPDPADSTEIVVDDTPEKRPPPAATPSVDTTAASDRAESIILIDDESQNIRPQKKSSDIQNISSLDEILFWLHDQLPLSEEELESLRVTMNDFKTALKSVQPSAKREGFVTVPDTTWDDIGSLSDIREELQLSIVAPVRHSKQFQSLGIDVPAGVLLFGPPGCGKTLLAKAIANEASINFISVKGPELLNMYVGESERAVRVCFERARNSAPCVIFFDELDALCPKRSSSDNSGTSRVVNQLLTEMDGVSGRQGVFLLAATNRVDIIDPAVLRPGRLDKVLYVGLPNANDRADILKAITKNGTKPPTDVSLLDIAERKECEGFTGADMAALVREASVFALKDVLLSTEAAAQTTPVAAPTTPVIVTLEHFNRAFRKIRGSINEKDRQYYEKMRRTYSSDRKDSEVEEMELS